MQGRGKTEEKEMKEEEVEKRSCCKLEEWERRWKLLVYDLTRREKKEEGRKRKSQ